MADEPLRVVPLEEEREGDQEGSTDFVFRRIGESVPLCSPLSPFDLQSPPRKPLAVSNRFGALFLAHSEGFLVVRTKDAIDAAKEFKENGKGPCLKELSLVDIAIGRVSLLEISSDSSMLGVAVGADIHLFSVSSLLKKEQKPSFSCALSTPSSVKDFKWLEIAKSYVALSDTGSLCHGDFNGGMKDVLDSVDAVDCSPDSKSFAVVRNNNLGIFSLNLEEQLRMPLSFESWSDSDNAKVDSIRWVRDDSIVVAATQLNDNGEEEGFLVQVIISGARNFFESSCKPVVFSFPYLFEGILDSILPSGFGPNLLTSYLDSWELLLTSNKKNVDQHVVVLKWCSNEGDKNVVSLEFQSDKYTPRIDLQENGEDNTIVGFGVEKVSLFEKITIQVGVEIEELAPQYIMVCFTCEGKLIMYHIARASDPSELPQYNIADIDLAAIEENKPATVSAVPTMEPSSVLSDKGEELKTRGENQSNLFTTQVGPTIQLPSSLSTGATLTTTLTESKTSNKSDSPLKGGFGGSSAQSPLFPSVPAFSTGVAENKISSEISSPFKGTLNLGTQNVSAIQPPSLFSTNSVPSTANQMTSSFKGPFSFGIQDGPTTQPSGVSSSSTAPGTTVTASKTMSQTTSSFGGAFALGTRNSTPPLNTFSIGATPSNTATESKMPGQITSPFKGSFGSAFGSVDGLTQKEGSLTTPSQSMKPFSNVSGTTQNEGSFAGPQPSFKAFSGTGLKLGSTGPGSDASAFNKIGERSPSLTIGIQNKPIQNIEAIPASRGPFAAAKEGFPVARSEKAQVKTTSNSSITTTMSEVESEQELLDDFYSIKDMTKELEKLLVSVEKEVEITSQQLSLLALDKHLKSLSESSLICKNNVEEQFRIIQELQDKMLQVTSRQIYMEGVVNQSSDSRYWAVWNCQKLAPEFEQKRQNILKANQNLTTQLVELERHFNNLEINRFGDMGRAGFNRRNVYGHPGSSRQTQSLQSVYNTLNSQLAAAEQLSECLTKQISMLNLDSPSPSSSKRIGSVKKKLFESIGLSYDPESYRSPDVSSRPVIDSSSVKMVSDSVKNYQRRSSAGLAKGVELETARRRRESLDKSWASVKPQKTTVRRVEKQLQQVPQKRFSISSDKKFKSNKEIFKNDVVATIGQASSSTSPVPLLLEQSITKLDDSSRTQAGVKEETPKLAAFPQQGAAFRLAREVSSPFPNLEQRTPPSQEKATRVVMEQPKFTVPSKSLSTSTKDAIRDGSDISLTNVSSVSSNKSAYFDAKGPPSGFSFSGLERESSTPSFSPFSASTQSADMGGRFSQPEMTSFVPKSVLSSSGKAAQTDGSNKDKSSSAIAPTVHSKAVSSFFQPSAPVSLTSNSFGGSKAGTESLPQVQVSAASGSSPPKPVQQSISVPTSGLSPPKPVQGLVSATSSVFSLPNPIQESVPSPQKQVGESVSKPDTVSSPPKLASESVSVPTTISSPPKLIPVPSASSGAAAFSSPTSPKPVVTVAPATEAPPVASGPSPVKVSVPETVSTLSATPKEATVATSPQKDEDEMEEEAPDNSTDLNLGALGGFGLGSGSASTAQSQPKPNPFGANLFGASNNPAPQASLTSSPSLTPSPSSVFRPPSLSFPSSQPMQQPSPPANTNPFAGSGFSGFGQPAQIGAGQSGFGKPAQIGGGQQALGSVLGTFGQSRQFGAGFGNAGSSPSGFGGGGFSSVAPSSGGFGGFASAATGGGFASAATGGGFAGGGFANAGSGGGFANAGSGGGFAALASKGGGGFAGAAAGASGFGGTTQGSGFGGGGFAAFSTQGGSFSAFSGSGPGRPPAELFSQMRK